MVREKESKRSLADALREQLTRYNEQNPIVETKYVVVEITPSRFIHSEYDDGDWTTQGIDIVSPMFDSPETAEEWMGRHMPDDGKTLKVNKYVKRKHTYYDWKLA